MEKLKVFDELYNPLEPSETTIDVVHSEGLWHQTFACWLVNKNKKTVLLQLRGPKNRIDPGSYDASASGHLGASENPDEGFRELQEELGVSINDEDKHYLGVFRNIAIRKSGEYINREFCHVYLASSNHSIEDFILEEGEVDGVYEVNIEEAIDLLTGKVDKINILGLNNEVEISVDDMCNYHERTNVSNYYLKVMLAAKALVEGSDELYI